MRLHEVERHVAGVVADEQVGRGVAAAVDEVVAVEQDHLPLLVAEADGHHLAAGDRDPEVGAGGVGHDVVRHHREAAVDDVVASHVVGRCEDSAGPRERDRRPAAERVSREHAPEAAKGEHAAADGPFEPRQILDVLILVRLRLVDVGMPVRREREPRRHHRRVHLEDRLLAGRAGESERGQVGRRAHIANEIDLLRRADREVTDGIDRLRLDPNGRLQTAKLLPELDVWRVGDERPTVRDADQPGGVEDVERDQRAEVAVPEVGEPARGDVVPPQARGPASSRRTGDVRGRAVEHGEVAGDELRERSDRGGRERADANLPQGRLAGIRAAGSAVRHREEGFGLRHASASHLDILPSGRLPHDVGAGRKAGELE